MVSEKANAVLGLLNESAQGIQEMKLSDSRKTDLRS